MHLAYNIMNGKTYKECEGNSRGLSKLGLFLLKTQFPHNIAKREELCRYIDIWLSNGNVKFTDIINNVCRDAIKDELTQRIARLEKQFFELDEQEKVIAKKLANMPHERKCREEELNKLREELNSLDNQESS